MQTAHRHNVEGLQQSQISHKLWKTLFVILGDRTQLSEQLKLLFNSY